MEKRNTPGINQDEVFRIEERLKKQGIASTVGTVPVAKKLGKLYRVPKTQEEIEHDDAMRVATFNSRLSSWAALKIAILLAVLFFAAAEYFSILKNLWFFGGIAGIFFSFILLITLLFAGYGLRSYIGSVVYAYGKSFSRFSYGLGVVLIIAIAEISLLLQLTTFAPFICIAITAASFGLLVWWWTSIVLKHPHTL